MSWASPFRAPIAGAVPRGIGKICATTYPPPIPFVVSVWQAIPLSHPPIKIQPKFLPPSPTRLPGLH